jgi:glycerate kinase
LFGFHKATLKHENLASFHTMKILVCADSFKGSLSAKRVLARGLEQARSDLSVAIHPLTDGGEGTMEVLEALGAQLQQVTVEDSWGNPVQASYAVMDDQVFIESAQAFGFREGASPTQALEASSAGVGQLIKEALNHHPREIYLTVGGTSGTDGGVGMLRALGVSFLDSNGQQVKPGGGSLSDVSQIDTSGLDSRLESLQLRVLTDVDNPLFGERGAARVFAAQKGADSTAREVLERGLVHLAGLLSPESALIPGAGAGGGLAFGALAVLGATAESGAQAMMKLTGFDSAFDEARLVITGEGSFDDQSLGGKITGAVIERARARSVPVVVVCGVSGVSSAPPGVEIIDISKGLSLAESLAQVERLLLEAGRQIASSLSG